MNPVVIPDAEVPAGYRRVDWAASQEEYGTLPSLSDGFTAWHRWEFTEEERRAIAGGASLEVLAWHAGGPLQPIALSVQGVEAEILEPF